ncbi:hypothetical protein M622_19350 [Thauera terpenica 58Eu]|jgi:uncharacterized protein (TIGR04255 family)|uniref:TIGR04255 family protein n=1 Tax=Thauera terpenica 58Eu TaxID=1348657 RepID=T0ATG4_9RHOO|nr:TIGR04255 family protein [Thauera terpenica]EPZ13963.1 hypothetical protein M622_19350 [Thauera terpenica 58Eu]
MTDKLPTKLKKEPLIDALFEMRFTSVIPASSVFPGVLFSKLPHDKTIERLPTEQLPKALLESEPNLRFAPLVRLHWDKFLISIGDRSLAVSCKMPYPGWGTFKPAILNVVEQLREIGIIQAVHRFSMKYIDLIPASSPSDQVMAINGTVVLGNHKLKQEIFSLRVEIPKEGLLHAVQITSSATATLQDGSSREGIIVDIDSISDLGSLDFGNWLERLPDQLELMHLANKAMFFECLRPETIVSLEPIYE